MEIGRPQPNSLLCPGGRSWVGGSRSRGVNRQSSGTGPLSGTHSPNLQFLRAILTKQRDPCERKKKLGSRWPTTQIQVFYVDKYFWLNLPKISSYIQCFHKIICFVIVKSSQGKLHDKIIQIKPETNFLEDPKSHFG